MNVLAAAIAPDAGSYECVNRTYQHIQEYAMQCQVSLSDTQSSARSAIDHRVDRLFSSTPGNAKAKAVSVETMNLIARLLDPNPNERMTAVQLAAHFT